MFVGHVQLNYIGGLDGIDPIAQLKKWAEAMYKDMQDVQKFWMDIAAEQKKPEPDSTKIAQLIDEINKKLGFLEYDIKKINQYISEIASPAQRKQIQDLVDQVGRDLEKVKNSLPDDATKAIFDFVGHATALYAVVMGLK